MFQRNSIICMLINSEIRRAKIHLFAYVRQDNRVSIIETNKSFFNAEDLSITDPLWTYEAFREMRDYPDPVDTWDALS